jgi:hypothetical protein
MKPRPSRQPEPPTPAQTDEAAAIAYVAQELPRARKALQRTRMVGAVLLVLVGTYISIISVTMVRFLQPREAAEVASGMVVQHIASDGPELAARVERQIPLFIRQLPDYLIQHLPGYRQELEHSLEAQLQVHAAALAKDLAKELDQQLARHQADLKMLLASPNDRVALRAVLPDLDQTITGFLTADAEGMEVRRRINDLGAGLKDIANHMDRLANGSNLTPEEKKARRSLAVLAKAIRDNTKMAETSDSAAARLASK